MPVTNFKELFVDRSVSLKLSVKDEDVASQSRIGGHAPAYFTETAIKEFKLSEYYYFFTLAEDTLPVITGKEVSVFFPKDFEVYNKNYKYPDFPLICIFHEPSARGGVTEVSNDVIKPKRLVSEGEQEDSVQPEDLDDAEEVDNEPAYGIKVGGNPGLIQQEDAYTGSLDADGWQFIMQFYESEYQRGQINGNSPFNNGAIYFYGKFNEQQELVEMIGGFWQN